MDKRVVLVVDDMPENIDLLVGLLKDRYIVKAARNGDVALKIAQSENPPDVVLLDIVMPGKDGFEVCDALKANPLTKSIPVIFLSGEVGTAERKRGEELGAAGYLTKPVNPTTLNETLEHAMS